MSRRSHKNRPPDHANPAPQSAERNTRKRDARTAAAVCVFLLAAVLLVFGQTLWHGFINIDDQDYVFWNSDVKSGLTPRGIQWAFTTGRSANWHPLTWLSHMADCQIYGPHADSGRNEAGTEQRVAGCLPYARYAWGHHLTNVLLHAANAILLFLVLWRMTGSLWPSAFAAALFALHPLRAESVAWVSERKDVLSGLFFLLTLAAYAGYARRHFSLRRYLAVVVLFALGLMAKPMLVTLPFVLLLLDYWPLGRMPLSCGAGVSPAPTAGTAAPQSSGPYPQQSWSRLIVEKLPLLALSAGSCAATLWAQHAAIAANERIAFPLRLANSASSLVCYLAQWLYPANLAAMYPFPVSGLAAERVAVAVLVLAAISLAVLIACRRYPYLFVGWLWYLGMLVPVIGLVQVGAQAMADRYTYLPQIGLAVALTWLAAALLAARPRWRLPCAVVASLILLDLAVCASLQTSQWRDSKTLWTHALNCTADNSMAHHGLGAALFELKQNDGAIAEFEESLKIRPAYAHARFSLGMALERRGERGDIDAAFEQYRQAVHVDPTLADAHYNLGVLLVNRGSTDEAIAEFRSALKYKPEQANAHYNLAACLERQGKCADAMVAWRAALQLEPNNVDTVDQVAWRLATSPDAAVRDGKKAIKLAQRAIELSHGEAPRPMSTLAAAYAEDGQFAEASRTAEQAIDLAVRRGETAAADEFRAQLKRYRANRPYRESPGQSQ
jgi:protein O-mannosyl-transferase